MSDSHPNLDDTPAGKRSAEEKRMREIAGQLYESVRRGRGEENDYVAAVLLGDASNRRFVFDKRWRSFARAAAELLLSTCGEQSRQYAREILALAEAP